MTLSKMYLQVCVCARARVCDGGGGLSDGNMSPTPTSATYQTQPTTRASPILCPYPPPITPTPRQKPQTPHAWCGVPCARVAPHPLPPPSLTPTPTPTQTNTQPTTCAVWVPLCTSPSHTLTQPTTCAAWGPPCVCGTPHRCHQGSPSAQPWAPPSSPAPTACRLSCTWAWSCGQTCVVCVYHCVYRWCEHKPHTVEA